MPDPEVVLITGTRKGIGRYLAEYFLRKGALVEGCSRSKPEWETDVKRYTHHCLNVADEAPVVGDLDPSQKEWSSRGQPVGIEPDPNPIVHRSASLER